MFDPVTYELAVKKGGGGAGGTTDYSDLTNKPQINGVTMSGDKSTEDLIPVGGGLSFDSDGKLESISSYDDLSSRPQINSVTLTGNKSLHDLGIAPESSIGTLTDAQWTSVQAILS